MILGALLLPSCGFIAEFMGGDEEEEKQDSNGEYTFQLRYNYLGTSTIDYSNPLLFLFIPLNKNNELEEDSFERAEVAVAFIPYGIVTLDLAEGSYSILAYIDSNGNSDLDVGEEYSFYYRRDLVSTFRSPDFIWVDSYAADWVPYFEMGSDYTMKGFFLLVPEEFETLYGDDVDVDKHFIYVMGLPITDTIYILNIYIIDQFSTVYPADPPFMQVEGLESWVIPINMFNFGSGTYTLHIDGFDSSLGLVDFYSVPFYYEKP
jgi:hypothetical protein